MSFAVRPAAPADTPAVLALSGQTLTAHKERFPDHFATDEAPAAAFLSNLHKRRQPGCAFVAEEHGIIIGWTGYARFDVPHDKTRADVLGLIMDITVADEAQGRGVGTALIEALVAHAETAGVTLLQADVWEGAPSAGILTRAGITPVKTVYDRRLAPYNRSTLFRHTLTQWLIYLLILLIGVLAGIILWLVR